MTSTGLLRMSFRAEGPGLQVLKAINIRVEASSNGRRKNMPNFGLLKNTTNLAAVRSLPGYSLTNRCNLTPI